MFIINLSTRNVYVFLKWQLALQFSHLYFALPWEKLIKYIILFAHSREFSDSPHSCVSLGRARLTLPVVQERCSHALFMYPFLSSPRAN